MPYLLSDNIWMKERTSGRTVHCSVPSDCMYYLILLSNNLFDSKKLHAIWGALHAVCASAYSAWGSEVGAVHINPFTLITITRLVPHVPSSS